MREKDKIIIVSGEFDPLDAEDLKFLKRCRSKGDWLCVGVHSDWWMMYARGGVVHS